MITKYGERRLREGRVLEEKGKIVIYMSRDSQRIHERTHEESSKKPKRVYKKKITPSLIQE